MTDPVVALLARLVPARDREAVLGDLEEESRRPDAPPPVLAVAGIALRYQMEPWRDASARLGALLTGALAWTVVAAVAGGAWADPSATLELYRDPLSRAAVRLWSAPHLVGAGGAGLVVGYAPWIPPFARSMCAHVVAVVAAAVAVVAPAGGAWLAVPVLLGTAWLAERARLDAPTHRDAPTRTARAGARRSG